MGFIKRFNGYGHTGSESGKEHTQTIEEVTPAAATPNTLSDTPAPSVGIDTVSLENEKEKKSVEKSEDITQNALPGVQKMEAAALVWTKPALYLTYAWIWVCFFMLALQQGTTTQFNALAFADFTSAPQVTTAGILGTIIGGILKLPIAKALNLWGRAEGFAAFGFLYLIGMVVLASSNGPNSYAVGYTLYWIGYDAIYYILQVFVADTSGLRNRAWAFGFTQIPFICTAFTAPLAATSFINTAGWRWGYGAFTIVMFFVFMPMVIIFKYFQHKAEKVGVFHKESSDRSWAQSTIHYFHEFDMIGCLILIAAFVLFLLPFSLSQYGLAEYSSGKFIGMLAVGVILFPIFAVWESYFAKAHFIKWELFKQRTVLGACALAIVLYFSFYLWDSNYYNFLLVAFDLNTTNAGYMSEIYNIGSCFWSFMFGIWIRQTKHFKYACLLFGLPLMILGSGLMIYFRGANHGIGYLIMCQVFIAVAGGTLTIGEEMAAMAAADRDGVPLLLALIYLSTSVGGAIGFAVAAGIYDNIFPWALRQALPPSAQADWEKIYIGGYKVQKGYSVGSDIRNAIDYAWAYTQRMECIASTSILALGVPAIILWKNYNVDQKQNKGEVI